MSIDDFLRDVLAQANDLFPEHRVLLLGSKDLDNGTQAEATIITNMEQDEVDLMFDTFRVDSIELKDDEETVTRRVNVH
jgi:hypothetical protein